MQPDGSIPGIDTSKPNVARGYDYLPGGKDNLAADPAMAEQLIKFHPLSAQNPPTPRTRRWRHRHATIRAVGAIGTLNRLTVGAIGTPQSAPLAPSASQVVRTAVPPWSP